VRQWLATRLKTCLNRECPYQKRNGLGQGSTID
jgi:hypothetical protein